MRRDRTVQIAGGSFRGIFGKGRKTRLWFAQKIWNHENINACGRIMESLKERDTTVRDPMRVNVVVGVFRFVRKDIY